MNKNSILLGLMFLFLLIGNVQATDITGCINITSSGEYYLQNDIYTTSLFCINITASNVLLDCNNHTIYGNRSPNSYGIGTPYTSDYNLSNITIRNCYLNGWWRALYIGAEIWDSKIINVHTSNSSNISDYANGILIHNGCNNVIIDTVSVNGTLPKGGGIALYQCNNSVIRNFVVGYTGAQSLGVGVNGHVGSWNDTIENGYIHHCQRPLGAVQQYAGNITFTNITVENSYPSVDCLIDLGEGAGNVSPIIF